MKEIPFSNLLGLTLTSIDGKIGDETLTFETAEGRRFHLHYYPDCCASCSLNEVHGDFADLIGSPIVQAEEVCSGQGGGEKPSEYADSWTWTFYKLSTVKGSVTLRWLGESNGYYSESVTFEELPGEPRPATLTNFADDFGAR